VLAGAPSSFAAECPGHPDAIGTSRTLVVDPREHPRIGSMQYPETLPLHDHEVVLTFDDGPLPRYSNQVLQILADNCVKATFFLIGQQARAFPDGVRKLVAAGHTIGTHSQDHPLTFEKMSDQRVKQEVDGGIASVQAALTDPNALAPFFRVPGLLRAKNVEDYLASKGIQIWSADFVADDWRHISSNRVYELAIQRLEARHKGILLLHDIHGRTAAALPRILHELKVRGYHIVQVVPATPERPPTPTDPQEWRARPGPESLPVAEGVKLPTFVFAEAEKLVTSPSDFTTPDGKLLLSGETFDQVKRPIQGTPAATDAWPSPTTVGVKTDTATLPAPSQSLFELPAKNQAALPQKAGAAGPHVQPSAQAGGIAMDRLPHRSRVALRHHVRMAHAGKPPAPGQAHAEKGVPHRSVKIASLKKREH
jgi:peptidoglycan/xylan/chitin deacetylase (PgdA/CDA1 family)